jgi:hypothetical protein
MADGVFNIAKGKIAYYAGLPATNDALILVLLKSAGLEADDTLNNYDDLAALLAAANDEMTFTGYARRTLGSVTVTVDDTNNRVDIDAADPASFTNTGGAAEACGKAVIVYDPDTTTGTDSTLVPLFYYDCAVSFDVGVATTISFNAAGIGRAS